MKKIKYKSKWPTILCIMVFTMLIFNSCKDDNNNLDYDCGCNSETLDTVPSDNISEVPDEEQSSGLLFYKTSEKIDGFYDDEQYNNRFWVFRGVEGCHNCQHHFIICNEEMIGAEFDYLKNTNDSTEVLFTGDLKTLCTLRPVLGDYFYAEINLTSIE